MALAKFLTAWFFLHFANGQSEELSIRGWREVEGIRQPQAIALVREAIKRELKTREDGEECGSDGLWGLELHRGATDNQFTVVGYTRGPRMGCLSSQVFDCAVSFRRAAGWRVNGVDCEPVNRGWED